MLFSSCFAPEAGIAYHALASETRLWIQSPTLFWGPPPPRSRLGCGRLAGGSGERGAPPSGSGASALSIVPLYSYSRRGLTGTCTEVLLGLEHPGFWCLGRVRPTIVSIWGLQISYRLVHNPCIRMYNRFILCGVSTMSTMSYREPSSFIIRGPLTFHCAARSKRRRTRGYYMRWVQERRRGHRRPPTAERRAPATMHQRRRGRPRRRHLPTTAERRPPATPLSGAAGGARWTTRRTSPSATLATTRDHPTGHVRAACSTPEGRGRPPATPLTGTARSAR